MNHPTRRLSARLLPFILLMSGSVLLQAAPATAPVTGINLTANPGFEETNVKPWEWFVAGDAEATGKIDTAEKHSGLNSFKITNESIRQPNVYGCLRQYISGLKPKTSYRVALWIKGDDISEGAVALATGPGWKKRIQLPSGSFDWRQVTIDFTTDETLSRWEVVVIADARIGALWVDDVSVSPQMPAGAASVVPHDAADIAIATWSETVPASAAYFPVFTVTDITAVPAKPVVRLQADPAGETSGNTLAADIRLARDSDKFFF